MVSFISFSFGQKKLLCQSSIHRQIPPRVFRWLPLAGANQIAVLNQHVHSISPLQFPHYWQQKRFLPRLIVVGGRTPHIRVGGEPPLLTAVPQLIRGGIN
jgi:hypothetical protein